MRNVSLFALALIAGAALIAGTAGGAEESTQPAESSELTVEQIVEKTNRVAYYQGADGRARVRMTITDARDRKRHREFTILRWDQPKPGTDDTVESKKDQTYTGEQKFYVYFHEPADVNKMVFMVWKHLDKDDDRWLYTPSLDLVKRIAGSEKRTSFVGSHFFYEDVSGRHIDADTHELQEVNDTYYVLKNTPKDPDAVEFSHYVMYIHKDTFLTIETRYFDRQGKQYRTYKAVGVRKIQGNWTVTKSRMTDTKIGGHTDMVYSDVEYDLGIPEDIFTERYLRRAPDKWLED